MSNKELPDCSCGNSYLAIRTDIYKDKREFIYCDCCSAMATRDLWCAALAAQPVAQAPDVDRLANIIREVDGSNSLGAGALAEKIVEALSAAPSPEAGKPSDDLSSIRPPMRHINGVSVDVLRRSAEASKPVQAESPKGTMFHDAGAVAQCQYCSRYTLDWNALGDRQPVCDCGKQHGWSGSFKPPGTDAKWHGTSPAALIASPAGRDSIIAKLQACADDPMWADHAEISKSTLRQAIAMLATPPAPCGAVEREALHDFITHRASWREAIENLAKQDDSGYWPHELRAYDRAMSALDAALATSLAASGVGEREALDSWYKSQPIKPFPRHVADKAFTAGFRAARASGKGGGE